MSSRLLRLLLAIASLFLIPQSLHAEEPGAENPFIKKFGGPYKEDVDGKFRSALIQYSHAYPEAQRKFDPRETARSNYESISKTVLDPALQRLDPRTEPEKKLKESAAYLKTLIAFVWGVGDYTEEERKAHQAFLDASLNPSVPAATATNGTKFQGALYRFMQYSVGNTPRVEPQKEEAK